MRRVVILGGYGATGRLIAELLLQDEQFEVTLAGRSAERGARTAATLSARFGGRAGHAVADAARADTLAPLLRGAELVVVASSTAACTQTVARSALRAGCHYYDILYSPAKLGVLRTLAPEFERAGACAITDGGFHPGLPAVLIRHAAELLDELHTAVVGSIIQQDWRAVDPGAETVEELLDMIVAYDSSIFQEGEWRKPRMREPDIRRRIAFGPPFGERSCYAMSLEELRALPERYPTLRSTGFFVGGFNAVVDWGVIPLALLGHRFAPQRSRPWLGRLLAAGLRHGSQPPFCTMLKLEATGLQDGVPRRLDLSVSHRDGYFLTAACVAAGVRELMDGTILRPGVWLQGQALEPARTLAELEALGVQVERGWKSPVNASGE